MLFQCTPDSTCPRHVNNTWLTVSHPQLGILSPCWACRSRRHAAYKCFSLLEIYIQEPSHVILNVQILVTYQSTAQIIILEVKLSKLVVIMHFSFANKYMYMYQIMIVNYLRPFVYKKSNENKRFCNVYFLKRIHKTLYKIIVWCLWPSLEILVNSQTLQFIKIENILGFLWTVPGKCMVHVFEMLDKMSLLLNN